MDEGRQGFPHLEETHIVTVGQPVDTGPVDAAGLDGTPPFSFVAGQAGIEIMDTVSDALPSGLLIDPDTGAMTGTLQPGTGAVDLWRR